jgi:hypothetical protein
MKSNVYKLAILAGAVFCVAVFSGLSTGCAGGEIPVPPPEPEANTITLYFRDAAKPATRALNDSLESIVRTVDILAFKLSYTQLLYAYHVAVDESDIHNVANDPSKKEFRITVENDHEKYQYVILANARAEVSACLSSGDHSGKLKEEILPKIVSENKSLWNTGAGSFRPIPMWGESEGEKTVQQLDGNEVKLYRSLARVDVKITTPLFALEKVYVYNRPSRGRLVPDSKAWNSEQKRFIFPSLPPDLGIVDGIGMNNVPYAVPKGATEFAQEIYSFETKEIVSQNFIDAACLVLGGTYHGKTRYYRVDFAAIPESNPPATPPDWGQGPPSSGTGEGGMVGAGDVYHPLLRNHRYELVISGVQGEGFLTPDSAVRSVNSQLIAEFITWNESNHAVVIDNSQYSLTIKPSAEVTISQRTSGDITIQTNYPNANWSLGEPTVDWFDCRMNSQKITVVYRATPTPPASGSVGFFKVKLMSGNKQKVSQQIKVVYK